MTVRKADAIRFGGFDEHADYRGYLCGPYELGWRLVNAGLPEVYAPELYMEKCSAVFEHVYESYPERDVGVYAESA